MNKPSFQLGPFVGGVDNMNPVRSLGSDTLREGVDIDVDNIGYLDARPIVKTVHTTASRAIFGNKAETIGLVAEGANLRRINSDDSRTTIYSSLNASRNVCYDEYLGMIYFSDGSMIAKTDGYAVTLLSSPDSRPFKETVRPGDIIAFHNDRLYTISGGRIEFSDSKSVETRDRRFCRLFVPGNITMFKPVTDGIWLSFGAKTYFVSGLDPTAQFPLIEKADYGALGQAIDVSNELFPSTLQGYSGKMIAWMSGKGVCYGGDGGTLLNVSARKFKITSGMRVSSTFLRVKNEGIPHIINIINS